MNDQSLERRTRWVWGTAVLTGLLGAVAAFGVWDTTVDAVESGFIYLPADRSFDSWMALLVNRLYFFVPFAVVPGICAVFLLAGAPGIGFESVRSAKFAAAGARIIGCLVVVITAITGLGTSRGYWGASDATGTFLIGAVIAAAYFGLAWLVGRVFPAVRAPSW